MQFILCTQHVGNSHRRSKKTSTQHRTWFLKEPISIFPLLSSALLALFENSALFFSLRYLKCKLSSFGNPHHIFHTCVISDADKIAWNYEKGMYVFVFHMQLHQSTKNYSLHSFCFSSHYSIPHNPISLRSPSLISKRRRKRSFWFQSISCSPGDPVYFFLILNPLECRATGQRTPQGGGKI